MSRKIDILSALDHRNPATIQALIDHHRSNFGGWTMKDDGDQGGDDGGQGKPEGSGKPDDKGDDGKGDGKPGQDGKQQPGKGDDDTDYKGKYDGQLQVNRNLEAQLNQLRNGLGEALGIKKDEKPGTDTLVGELQQQMQSMQRELLVERLAREHNITDASDLTLLKQQTSEDAMKTLAARLKPADGGDGDGKGNGGSNWRGTPRPDPAQGRGNSGGTRPGSVKQVMEERRAARDKAKQ